ncbi:unnamed protein product, partial [Prorocentrum cordatum]
AARADSSAEMAEDADASTGAGVSVRAVPPEDAYPRVAAYVSVLGKPRARCCVVLPWLALSLGGLSTFPRLIPELESSVPPVQGTPSYTAMQSLEYYQRIFLGVISTLLSSWRQ